MKRQMILAAAILGIVILSACGKKDVSSEVKQETMVQNEESTEKDVAIEETKKYKIEKHEEDWKSDLIGVGYLDWNANMPKVGKFGFTNNIYVPTVLDGKKLEGDEKPYFFMNFTLIGRDSESTFDVKRVENLEEVPEMMMGINKLWEWAASSISTMQMDIDEVINPVIETKEKVVIDGYEFMRVTGKFEIAKEESKEIVKERKYIAYFYNEIPLYAITRDYEPKIDDMQHKVIYWCEGYAKDTEGKDFDLVIETADKMMSTLKLHDDQRKILDFWK